LIRHLVAALAARGEAPVVRVIDTTGQGGRAAGCLRFAAAGGRLVGLRAAGRVQLVHAHMTTRGSALRKGLLCALAILLRVPVVVHMHGADFAPFYRRLNPAWRLALRTVLRRARRVIVVGEGWRRFLVAELGLEAARVSVIGNGVPPIARRARPPGPAEILFLGRLGARKGVPELIEALADPKMAALEWRATLAGDGEVAAFRARVRASGLQARVDVPGWSGREATEDLLARADILVLPSRHEAMPMAVLEALAAGVAVIATPVGAIPEFLVDGETALLVAPGDVGQLRAALARLIGDPGERARLAAAGRALFDVRFDVGRAAAALVALYGSVLEEAGLAHGGLAGCGAAGGTSTSVE
jgi:glycosyltransferase involved in cell wall biosynthesis